MITTIYKDEKLKCKSCQLLIINGVPCHETGCPNSHIDPETGYPYQIQCSECGFDFTPEDDETICPCCRSDEYNTCEECEHEFYCNKYFNTDKKE